MGKYSRPEVEYNAEEGFVRLNIRRPVNLYVPTEVQDSYDPEAKGKKPSSSLELEWVHGYRGKDNRNNIFKLESGELVYFAAAVGIIYNPEDNTQKHYTEHTDDIKCIAVHPDGKTVATGQIKGRDDNEPHVRVWNSETLETIGEFGSDTFNRGVSCVAFSHDGNLLAAIDDAPEPKLSVWKWQDGEKVSEGKASSDNVIAVAFTKESPARIVTSGKGHMGFWTLNEDGTDLSKRSGIFGDHDKPKYVTSLAPLESGDVISGDTNGNLLVWGQGGNAIQNSVKNAHEGPVFFVGVDEEGTVISGGKDQKVIEYSAELEPTKQLNEIPEEYGSPRMVVKVGDDVYIGTTKNAILKTSFDSEDPPTVLTQGHLEELWGAAAFHGEPHFITAGQDGKMYCRNGASHEIVWSKDLEMACQSAAISKNDQVIIVGGDSGKWVAIDNETQETIHEGQDGDEPIQVIRFSPDGTKLALGSRDNKIYVYDFNEEEKSFDKKGECEGHSSFITHLDWSEDGEMLRTNSGDYEVLFWKPEDCSMVTQSEEYRDVQWATNNCILAFNSIGIWPPGTDGTHINTCNKAVEKPLLATGDDFGMLKLFAYPSTQHNAPHEKNFAHSSHITNVIFFSNDSRVISTGGRDLTAMQWKVKEA